MKEFSGDREGWLILRSAVAEERQALIAESAHLDKMRKSLAQRDERVNGVLRERDMRSKERLASALLAIREGRTDEAAALLSEASGN